jgi:transglycosylase-like protein with SLT domain
MPGLAGQSAAVLMRRLSRCCRPDARRVQGIILVILLCGGLFQPVQAARHHSQSMAHAAPHHAWIAPAAKHVSIERQRSGAHASHASKRTDVDGGLTPQVVNAIRTAERKAHADPLVLLAIAWQESRFDPKARNKQSSARGLLQFTNTTWLTVVRDFGARHGLAQLAAAIQTGDHGELTVKNRRLRQRILALRDNPELESVLAAERLMHEREHLEVRLGRSMTAADFYVLHLLGPVGALGFLTELADRPDSLSVGVVGRAANPNQGLFVRDGRTLTLAETYDSIRGKLVEQAALHAKLFTSAS